MSVELLLHARCELIRRASDPTTFERSGAFCRQHGLDFIAVEAACGLTAILPASFDGTFFDFDNSGETAVVVEVFDKDGATVIDLAAWPLDEPERVRTMFQRAPLLGLAAAYNPSTFAFGSPLRIYRSAVDWLRASGLGCVVLDERQGVRALLDLPGPIAGVDERHARELKRMVDQLSDPSRFLFPAMSAA